MLTWYVTIKLAEWLIWFCFGFYFLRVYFMSGRALWVQPFLAGALFVFGLADFAEYFTRGHFPWWLWAWKIGGGLGLFGLLMTEDYLKRGSVALAPWRFAAAGIILAMSLYCMSVSVA